MAARTDYLPVLSLCSGVGGLDLGLRIAEPGATTVCYVEREAYCASVLVARMEDEALCTAPIWDDVKTFDGDPWRGRVDCIVAGYPCQPFSTSGKRQGVEDERHIWPHIRIIISQVLPEWVFLENVPGHVSLGLDVVVRDLSRMGYSVQAGLFSAEEVGAPQKRERLFILARLSREMLLERDEELGDAYESSPNPHTASRTPRKAVGESSSELADTDRTRRTRQGLRVSSRGQDEDVRHAGGPSEEMADSSGERSNGHAHKQRQPAEGRGNAAAGRAGTMADSERARLQRRGDAGDMAREASSNQGEGNQRERRGSPACDCGTGINPCCELEIEPCPDEPDRWHVWDSCVNAEGLARIREEVRAAFGDIGVAELGDSNVSGLEGRSESFREGADELPPWPPSPSDDAAWRHILGIDPTLAPAIQVESELRGLVDGSSCRVERLAADGNGVVPLVAAYAWRTLNARFSDD